MNTIRAVRRRFAVGHLATATDPSTLRRAVAELLATAIFVFAAEAATLSLGRMQCQDNKGGVVAVGGGGLVAVALAHALALAAAVACAANTSGGHVNPAVTFGALLAGRISLARSLVYWAAQLLGAVAAALLLRLAATADTHLPEYALATAAGVTSGWQAAVLEAAMAFGLMHAYMATVMADHRRHPRSSSRLHTGAAAAPLAVGLLAGANVLACGALEGAVMNPARAFGPAVVGSRRWGGSHWAYWAGPMLGAGLSGIVYERLVAGGEGEEEEEPKPSSDGGGRRRA